MIFSLLIVFGNIAFFIGNIIYFIDQGMDRRHDEWFVNSISEKRDRGLSIKEICECVFFPLAHFVLFVITVFRYKETKIGEFINKPKFFKRKQ